MGGSREFAIDTIAQKEGAVTRPRRGRPIAAAGRRAGLPYPLPLAAEGVRPGQATETNEVAALTRTIVQTSALNTETATC